MLQPTFKKNDQKAKLFIYAVSIIVFAAVVILSRIQLKVDLPFNPHLFASISATINSIVAVLLLAGLITVKQKNYELHKKIMMTAIVLSVLFLLSYIAHHLFAGETKFGGEGTMKTIYYLMGKTLKLTYQQKLFTNLILIALPIIEGSSVTTILNLVLGCLQKLEMQDSR